MAYAVHLLCGNPYAHTLRATAELWAADWTGHFAGRATRPPSFRIRSPTGPPTNRRHSPPRASAAASEFRPPRSGP
jgi:hypothetical protein